MTTKKITQADKDIGACIKRVRDGHDFTQEYMAGRIGVSIKSYQNYEGGKTRIPASNLKIIAETLLISSDILLGKTIDGDIQKIISELKIILKSAEQIKFVHNALEAKYRKHETLIAA